MKAQELSPIYFTFQNYEVNPFDRLDIPYDWDSQEGLSNVFIRYIVDHLVGWCDSEKLTVRPRPGYAVMCEDEQFERFWFHVSKELFEDKIKKEVQQ